MLRMKAIKLNYQNIRVKVNKLIFQSSFIHLGSENSFSERMAKKKETNARRRRVLKNKRTTTML